MFKVVLICMVLSTIVVGEESEIFPTVLLSLTAYLRVEVSCTENQEVEFRLVGQWPKAEFEEFGEFESVTFNVSINKPLKDNEYAEFSKSTRISKHTYYWKYENGRELRGNPLIFFSLNIYYRNRVYQSVNNEIICHQHSSKWRYLIFDLKTESSNFEATSSTTKKPAKNRKCILSQTVVISRNVCTGRLIFEDNFDNLNWNKWQRDIRIPSDSYDADFVSFQGRPENSYVSNGQLYIVPSLLSNISGFDDHEIRLGLLDLSSECTGNDFEKECIRQAKDYRILPPVVSAKIHTKDIFTFRYGRVEVRAKLPKGDWLFPLITLDPVHNYYGSDKYKSGQMRVAFIHGNEHLDGKDGYQINGQRLSGGVVLSQGENFRNIWLQSRLYPEHFGNDFHNYSLVWTNESITLSVDGHDYATISGSFSQKAWNINHARNWAKGGTMAPFDKEFYISLGVSAGGISDFPDESQTNLRRHVKPWINFDPKGELRFWQDQINWHRTWKGTDAGLIVDYIRVYAL